MTRAGAVALTALVLAGCASGETSLKLPSLGLGSEKRPLVADLKPGPYEASRLAIGEAKDLAQQRGEGVGFVPSSSLGAYLNRIRAKLLTGSGVIKVPGRIVILANPGFVAYSTPDGNVYVAMAWLPVLTNEDEVAAIIAHELSHVLLTHHSSDVLVGVRMMRNYDMAFAARKLLDRGKASEAYAQAQAAATGRTATHAYPNWILARSAMARGRSAEAVAALERAIKANEPIRAVYDDLISANEHRGNLDAALAWTDKASTTFGESERWTPTKIRLLRKAGRVEEASTLTLKCAVDAPDWRRHCQEANQTPAGRSRRAS